MCHFITMVTSPGTDRDSVSEVFRRYRRKVVPLKNRSIVPNLHPGESYFYPQEGMCDCGTALGSLNHQRDAGRVEKKCLDDLRKKGWSETKITRWVEQKKSIGEREERIQKLREEARGSDPDGWCGIMENLLVNAGALYAGLILHSYSGGLETERIERVRRIELEFNANLGEALFHMEEDTIYVVRNSFGSRRNS